MAISTLSVSGIDRATMVILLNLVLPFPVGFLASLLFYRRAKTAGLQPESFSPPVAAILATPLLAVGYYVLATGFIATIVASLAFLTLFAPIILSLLPLLVIYLRGGFQRRWIFGLLLSAASIAVVVLEVIGLYYVTRDLE
jgi:hypothetical protein